MQAKIVAFEPEHLSDVVELSLRAWEPVFESIRQVLDPEVFSAFYPDWREVQRGDVTTACLSDEHHTWVAVVDGHPVGFVDITRPDDVLAEIHMLAVDPAHQGQGLGSQLTRFAIEQMTRSGAKVAMVQTGGDPGHEPARRTYEAAGFRLFPAAQYFKRL